MCTPLKNSKIAESPNEFSGLVGIFWHCGERSSKTSEYFSFDDIIFEARRYASQVIALIDSMHNYMHKCMHGANRSANSQSERADISERPQSSACSCCGTRSGGKISFGYFECIFCRGFSQKAVKRIKVFLKERKPLLIEAWNDYQE